MSVLAGRRGDTRGHVAVVRACQGCGACLLTCPAAAIRPVRPAGGTRHTGPDRASRPDAGAAAVLAVREDLCTGCAECVEVCPVDAIELVPRRQQT